MKVKVADIATLNANPKKYKGVYPVIQYLDTSSVDQGKFLGFQVLDVESDDIPSRAQRAVKDGTIVISTVRPNLKHYAFFKKPDENVIVSSGFVTVDAYPEKVDAEFLYYVLTSDYTTAYLDSIASTAVSSYPSFNPDDLGRLEIDIPTSIDEQKRIAKSLAVIDSKTFNNTAICSELEAMAKLLYDYWFVQFDFPDENGKPYKSSGGKMVWNKELKRDIPEGWNVEPLFRYCQFENGDRGGNYPSGNDFLPTGIPFVAGGALKDDEIDHSEVRFISEAKYNSLRAGKASKGEILMTLRGSLAKCVYSPYERMAIASALVIVRPKNGISNEFLHRVLVSDYYVQLLKNYDNGSVQANLSVDTLKSFPVVVPSEIIMNLFTNNIHKIEMTEVVLREENQQLASLRDFLLPMLMNGQVKVI